MSPYAATDQKIKQMSLAQAATSADAAQAAAPASAPDTFLQPQEQDELLPKAMDLVRQHQRASASMLQRRLRIGYTKAAQLIDLMEQQGIVGPAEGGRSREVLKPLGEE
jgi:S-DNA-T family DNA segregation ATPase FtsK/SpoIIIE